MNYPKTLAAVEVASKNQWLIADALLDEVGTPVPSSTHDGSADLFQQCADELAERGHEYRAETLRHMRNTAFNFPAAVRAAAAPVASWTVFNRLSLRGHPEWLDDLLAVLDGKSPATVPESVRSRIVKRGRIAAIDVTEMGDSGALMREMQPFLTPDPLARHQRRQLEAAREILAVPELAKQLMRDPVAQQQASAAKLEIMVEETKAKRAKVPTQRPSVETAGQTDTDVASATMALIMSIDKAQGHLLVGIRSFDKDPVSLPHDLRDLVTEHLDDLQKEVTSLRDAISANVTDEDLAQFMAGP